MYISRKQFFLRFNALKYAIEVEYFRIKRDLVSDNPRTYKEVCRAIDELEMRIELFRLEMKNP